MHVQRSVHLLLSVVVFTFLPGHGAAAHVHQAADLRVCHCFLDLGSADALRDALENFIAFRNPAGVELAGQGLEGQGRIAAISEGLGASDFIEIKPFELDPIDLAVAVHLGDRIDVRVGAV